ncbi:transposase, partial [Sutterella sp.]
EATNNKIKLIIRKAYGFREVKNLIDMVDARLLEPEDSS